VEPEHGVVVAHHADDAPAASSLARTLQSFGVSARCDLRSNASNPETTARLAAILGSKFVIAWLSESFCLDADLQLELMHAVAACTRHASKERIMLIDSLDAQTFSLPSVLRSNCQVVRVTALPEIAPSIAQHVEQLRGSIGSPDEASANQHEFVGRIGHLWQIHEALCSAAPNAPRVAQLSGDPGSGKTWLADEYARRFRAAYPGGVFRLDAGWFERPDSTQLRVMRLHAWRAIAATLGLNLDSADESHLAAAVRRRLEHRNEPFLWIVDHMPAHQPIDEVRDWLAPASQGATILIARTAEYASVGLPVSVDGIGDEQARAMLARRKPMTTSQESGAGRELIAQLGGHALAVRLVSARLARSTYDRMLLQLAAPDREAAQLADGFASSLQHPQLVGIAVAIQRSLARLSPQARQALRLASVLAAAPVPIALLTTALAQQARNPSADHSVSHTELVIDELPAAALAERVGDSLVLTPLVRESVLHTDKAADMEAARQLLITIIASELAQAPTTAQGNPYWHWLPHLLHLSRTAAPSSLLVELNGWLARFHELLGPLLMGNHQAVTLLEQGDLAAAQQLLDMEMAARRIGIGEHHPHLAAPANNLGAVFSLRGDLPRARALFKQAIELRRKALGDAHPDLLAPMNNLGVVLWQEGEFAKARLLFEKVLERRRQLLGDRHPDTLVTMRNLAVVLRHEHEYVSARALLEHVVEVRRSSLGTQHVDTCTAMASLAETLRDQSDAILARVSDPLSIDAPLLGPDTRIARA
jgi:tetratricopeptide (TPR) repeat protein